MRVVRSPPIKEFVMSVDFSSYAIATITKAISKLDKELQVEFLILTANLHQCTQKI
jgi:hypothetical protein